MNQVYDKSIFWYIDLSRSWTYNRLFQAPSPIKMRFSYKVRYELKKKTKEQHIYKFYSVKGISHQSIWSNRLSLGKFRPDLLHLVIFIFIHSFSNSERTPGWLTRLNLINFYLFDHLQMYRLNKCHLFCHRGPRFPFYFGTLMVGHQGTQEAVVPFFFFLSGT